MAGVIVARIHVFTSAGAPLGVDGGNWLAFGDPLLSSASARGISSVYPPVVPMLVAGAVRLFGSTYGIATMAALSSAAPAAGFFLVIRREIGAGPAAVIASLILVAPSFGDAAAWGAYPQLLASPIMLFGLRQLDRWLRQGTGRALVWAALCGAFVLGISHFTSFVGLVGAVCLVAFLSADARTRGATLIKRAAAAVCAIAFAALPLAPVYRRLVPALLSAQTAEPRLAKVDLLDVPGRFAEIHAFLWPLWAVGVVIALGVTCRRAPHDTALGRLNVGIGAGVFTGLLLSQEPRMLYEVPIVAAIGFGSLAGSAWWRWPFPHGLVVAGALTWIAVMLLMSSGFAETSRARYQVLDPNLLEGIQWIERETAADDVVAVAPLHDAPLGWWIEGLAHRSALTAAPLRWLVFPQERDEAAAANRLFFKTRFPSRAGVEYARALGVDYVLLPRASLAYDEERVESFSMEQRPAYENAGVVVFAVDIPAYREGGTR